MDKEILSSPTPVPSPNSASLPALPPRPSLGPAVMVKAVPPPLPDRPDLVLNEKENYSGSNSTNSLERPKQKIPPPSSSVQAPPLPSRPPLANSLVPQLPARPQVETPEVTSRPPPLPSRHPADVSVSTPLSPEKQPLDRECQKSGPPPRPKSSPVSVAGEVDHNQVPPLPRRDLPTPITTAVTTNEDLPEQPQAPPRRPKRGPTVVKAPSKPIADESLKGAETKLVKETKIPESISATKELVIQPHTDKIPPENSPNLGNSSPIPTVSPEKMRPPPTSMKRPSCTKEIDNEPQKLSASSEQDKGVIEQCESKDAHPREPVFAPFQTGRVRGLVLKKLSREIATLQEHHDKPIHIAEDTDKNANSVTGKEDLVPKPKPRPTIISAKSPEVQKPGVVEEANQRDLNENLDSQASLETGDKFRPAVCASPLEMTVKDKNEHKTIKVSDDLQARTPQVQDKTENVPCPNTTKENVVIKPKPKPTIIAPKRPKLRNEGCISADKPTSEVKDLNVETKPVASKTDSDKQDIKSVEVPKAKPKPTIIKAVKPFEKGNDEKVEEKQEERKQFEAVSKSDGSVNSPPPQRAKPKTTIIYANKPSTEKKVPPPRPARIPSAKNKPDKEKPQIQPKQVTSTQNPSRKKKPHLPFSTFYVDFEEMTDETSNAPKLDVKPQNKAPVKRPPPSRPVPSKGTSTKATSSLHSDKEITRQTLNSENVNSEPKATPSEAPVIIDKPKKKSRPPRPYSAALTETDLQDNSKQFQIEDKETKPKPARPRSLCEDVKITEQQIQAADITSKASGRAGQDPQVMQGDGNTKEHATNAEKTPTIVKEIEKSKPKPGRPAPVGPGKTKTKPSRPAQLVSRHEKQNHSEDKKQTKEPPKTKLIQPASTQISSVCPTKIDPVAVALYNYQPTSTEDLEFQAGAEIFLLRRIDNQWLYGRCGEEEGVFPQNFVEIIEDLPEEDAQDKKGTEDKKNADSPKVTALYDFQGNHKEGELNFSAGDVIDVVAKINDEWLKGTFEGQIGIFPCNFVDCSNFEIKCKENIFPNDIKEPNKEQRTNDTISGPRCKAIFDYHSSSPDDLSFDIGDIIRIVERVNEEWLKGDLAGRTGMFPNSFVEVIEDLGTPQQDDQEKVLWHAVALHDFISETSGDLQFKMGAEIAILEVVSDDWLKGELDGKKGIFPSTYVEKRTEESNSKLSSSKTANFTDKEQAETNSMKTTSHQVPEEFTPKAKALYDFEGETNDEISFKTGDVVCLLDRISEDWMSGEINGNVGRFPTAFVEILVPLP